MPSIDGWVQISNNHIFLVIGVCAIEGSEPHVRARFNRRLRLAVQVEGAISTIAYAKLLAGDGEGAMIAIPHKNASARCTDEDLRVRYVIDLYLLAMIEEEDLALLAVVNYKRLTLNGAWILL